VQPCPLKAGTNRLKLMMSTRRPQGGEVLGRVKATAYAIRIEFTRSGDDPRRLPFRRSLATKAPCRLEVGEGVTSLEAQAITWIRFTTPECASVTIA